MVSTIVCTVICSPCDIVSVVTCHSHPCDFFLSIIRTQVKTKHLSQLCTCGKSTRFYCICSVGTMRCKDCFIKHCRDHTNQHECSVACPPECEAGAEVIAEGVELVTTKKRKRNNPTQAIQSRCVVCKAKTCYCCLACGFEKEVALCHVSTGRNCLPIHTSEHHTNSKCSHGH